MQRKLTVELTVDEVKEAIQQYVTANSGDKVSEIQLACTKLNEFNCLVICDTEQVGTNETKEEA